jgi:hypothetical protein
MRPEREETSHRFCNLLGCTISVSGHKKENILGVTVHLLKIIKGFVHHKQNMVWCHYHFLPPLPVFFGHPMGRQLCIVTLVV